MPVTEISNFINQTFRAPLRPDIEQAKYRNALLRQDVAAEPQRQRMRELNIQGAEQDINQRGQEFGDQQKANARGILAQGFAAIAQSQNPQVAAQQFLSDPNFKAAGTMLGLPVDQFTPDGDPEQLRSSSMDWARALGAELQGQSRGYRVEDGPGGSKFSVNQDTGQYSTLLGREPQQPTPANAPARYRALSPQEVQMAGLPPGSSAQLNESTGQISILNKTEAATPSAKIPRLAAAERRLERVAEASTALGAGGGPIQGRVQSFVGTVAAQELEAANAQLLNELTALTRTPGIGSQSDLEQRLAALQLPGPSQHPEVRERSIQELRAFIADLSTALNATADPQGGGMDMSSLSDAELQAIINGP